MQTVDAWQRRNDRHVSLVLCSLNMVSFQIEYIRGSSSDRTFRMDSVLLFQRKFLAQIRSGEKTQTIRLWPFRRMRSGQRSYIPGVGHIRVTLVEEIDLEALTDEDAIPDGFPTAEALQQELQTIYGEKIVDGYQAYRVVFHRIEDFEEPVASKNASDSSSEAT